ncbi:glycosyltransferase family 2 protein [Patescibacteria group bacterium]|nr:glycosyltransferase family 2 protein [Patescibacteria group bacterium]
MKSITTLSIAIATYNEESFISRCLESVSGLATEIVLVDGSSSDQTVTIAKKFPHTKIISTDNKPMFHINKQLAIDNCKSDWILQLDADEVVSPELKNEISHILSKDINTIPENGFWIKRRNYFLGKFLKKGGQYPDLTLRFYKRGHGHLPCLSVHEQAKVDGQTATLQHDLLHYADSSFNRYLDRHNRYTTIIAKELDHVRLQLNFVNFITYFFFKPVCWFLKTYIRHRGYVDGFPGFAFSFFSALRFPIAYAKLYEYHHHT